MSTEHKKGGPGRNVVSNSNGVSPDESAKKTDKPLEERTIADILAEAENLLEPKPEPEPYHLEIEISSDKMSAFLKVLTLDNPEPLEAEAVLEKLAEMQITYGINEDGIRRFCQNRKYFMKFKVAAGFPPTRGEDGFTKFGFETNPDYRPKEEASGVVDYKNLGLIQNVEADQLLCAITPPTEGITGFDVFGRAIEARAGDMPSVIGGRNTYTSEDLLNIYAKTTGNVRLTRTTIDVDDVWVVKGDVGATTGNIDFGGTVEVRGNVLEGFDVTAKDDIIVKGLVEGSVLRAGRNVLIKEGFNGMKKGIITAGGDVTCKFIETGKVECGGEFFCDVALNSNVQAAIITIKGKKASLIGGEYTASEMITAKNIGSEKNIPVTVSIIPKWEEKAVSLAQKIKQLGKELEQIDRRMDEVKKFDHETIAQKTVTIQKLLSVSQELINQKTKLEKELYKVQLHEDGGAYRVNCTGQIFCGVKVFIGGVGLRINNTLNHQSFFVSGGEIAMIDCVVPKD